ncbi:MAG: response regulator transcription factor [Devosia sp.]|jgi:DNA-binding response OmpR family regulator|nr:response regulator transcription factor [Devosia sp.]RYE47259.1 MAG: response regulator transcription factor [Hyphomicrobiales bacterium]
MKVLVVEDDRRIASFLERGLAAEGYQVSVENDGRDGLERARQDDFELIILDRMLPYVDGLEITRLLREERRPAMILMLTAKDSLADKIEGLKGGADDYLTKPFAFDELLARLVALRRRRSEIDHESQLAIGPLTLDPQSRRVSRDGEPISLTVREFDLLRYLMSNPDKVVSRQRLLNSVWEYGYDPGTKIVDVYVRYLRAKIDTEGSASLIQTVRGVGYMMPSKPAPSLSKF